ncbi:methyltransferase domain-containing protein [Salsipaludibacter albus]|uniref:methyltransferase domain-containing protein n=1 Tax=Salsipaludibacter albus TaxID=2849650 RepID=UPI001EE40420|nr:methyltransferase domain-containing protein [Salsipaludibacter albus]MBY5162023.1 methyltransferase domain-containing protein [Salsipaludibacter albus]
MSTTTAPTTTTSTGQPFAGDADARPTLAEQAPVVLGHLAGHVGHRTVLTGLRHDLLATLADHPGATSDELADRLDLDDFYTSVWCRGAIATGLIERDGEGLRLAPHMASLLLDEDSPAYVGGVFEVFARPEVFDAFDERLATGDRTWWDQTSDEWIEAVGGTGRPFYTRLVPDGLAHVPGLVDRLEDGCRVLDMACGTGAGVLRLAATWPDCEVVGVDGDARSLEVARGRAESAGVGDRVTFVHSPLETFTSDRPATLVVNNISMHECRDIDAVMSRVVAALEPGGWFVISDLPFPTTDEGLRTAAGRIMSGIQYYEAQIDDQLLPRSFYDELLQRHGFVDLGAAELTPVHALTWGATPAD